MIEFEQSWEIVSKEEIAKLALCPLLRGAPCKELQRVIASHERLREIIERMVLTLSPMTSERGEPDHGG